MGSRIQDLLRLVPRRDEQVLCQFLAGEEGGEVLEGEVTTWPSSRRRELSFGAKPCPGSRNTSQKAGPAVALARVRAILSRI
jgi:hypothetical protein